jgi:hypothetical protein
MIDCEILTDDAIVIVQPSGPLSEDDFTALAAAVDAYLENHVSLAGLLIYTETFPGWKDFEGFVGHMKFVKDHHQRIQKVALVSDSRLSTIAPKLASHFISAEVRSFSYNSYGNALAWLRARD